MKILLVTLITLLALALVNCSAGGGMTPDSPSQVTGCSYAPYGETCQATFDNGDRGYIVYSSYGTGFICKGPNGVQ
jgi:hypothetical protein